MNSAFFSTFIMHNTAKGAHLISLKIFDMINLEYEGVKSKIIHTVGSVITGLNTDE